MKVGLNGQTSIISGILFTANGTYIGTKTVFETVTGELKQISFTVTV